MNTLRVSNIHGEHGGARLKLVVFLIIFASVLYAGYLYVPVAIDAYYFKDVMQNMVNQATAQGGSPSWVRDQLVKSEPDYHVPPEAVITPTVENKRMSVRVQFIRPISLPGYTYNYEFDYTAQSTTFLTK
ncbi:MAG TPA: hypothetical protein VNF70_07285 [Pyrinomonadaceae bacterium]|nr:hypothetical protein [Pyrinomonadaceae bacterium]